LLVAFTVALIIVGSAMSIALSSREMLTIDEGRTRLNQNLRGTVDLLGIDIRQAGERLPGDFPALEIVNGAAGAPDILILRRNLLDEVLPLCQDLEQATVDEEIFVADGDPDPPQGCSPVADDDGDGFPDNVDVWRDYRLVNGGLVPVYLYNPVSQLGEWFQFDDDGSSNLQLHKGNDDPWQADYEVDQQGRLYMLEQRAYAFDNGVLAYTLNQDADNPVRISANLIDFQVRALLADGSTVDSLDASDEWTDLRAVEITIQARVGVGDKSMTREITTRFFPRNILSN